LKKDEVPSNKIKSKLKLKTKTKNKLKPDLELFGSGGKAMKNFRKLVSSLQTIKGILP
jgi:hypothetical protein